MGFLCQRDLNIKELQDSDIPALCGEIREFLIDNLSQNGGHLASNLGTVELTVALHRVFDTAWDRIVFDVGHQCYTHKLLTGRKEGFSTFRHLGSIAGFPKPDESPHDAFATGHASTSVSAALGMARAFALKGEDRRAVAVIGDGALTGGLAYEGLNDAGQSGLPLIVVLNDNGMSIAGNVGGVSKHLAALRVKPQYFMAKSAVHRALKPIPGGKVIETLIGVGKRTVKEILLPETIFENMGFTYLGPMDGHDVEAMVHVFRQAVSLDRPVLVHLSTIKGKGYSFSEANPSKFHGVARFNIGNGKSVEAKKDTFSSVFGKTLTELADNDGRICAITAAMRSATGLDPFCRRFKARFFDVGIAEGHAVTMAAGLAKQGMRPVVAIYSTFLQRAYDQIIHDVALQRLPVVFAIDRAGLVGEDGETHHGVFDAEFISSIPNMRLYCPASFAELSAMLAEALAMNAPAAIRYPRGGEGEYAGCGLAPAALREGGDATIVTHGFIANEAVKASDLLKNSGIGCSVIKLDRLKPFDKDKVKSLLKGKVFLLEENIGVLPKLLDGIPLNLDGEFVSHGTREELLRVCGIDGASIAHRIANA